MIIVFGFKMQIKLLLFANAGRGAYGLHFRVERGNDGSITEFKTSEVLSGGKGVNSNFRALRSGKGRSGADSQTDDLNVTILQIREGHFR